MKRRLIGSLAGVALAAGAMVATAVPGVAGIDPDPLDPQTFEDPSANPQSYTVPDGCTEVTIEAFGAEGGAGGGLSPILGASGGNGASATSTVTVTGGEMLEVNVGGEGGDAPLIAVSTGGDAGANGGAPGGDGLLLGGGGGGGGGASDVRQGGAPVVVAAGGGGGGSGILGLLAVGAGGDGGEVGQDGQTASTLGLLLGGRGGQSGGNGGLGGAAGLVAPAADGGDGSPGIGGDGGDGLAVLLVNLIFGGGGGAGGVIGGGGGGAGQIGVGSGGGGGGNSLGTTFGEGVETGDGRVIITPVAETCDGGEPPVQDCTDPPPDFFQPDATRETPRLGDGVYDFGSPEFQTQFHDVKPRFGSTLDIYIQNDGNATDSFVLTGEPGAPPFLVRYQQLKAADGSLPKNYITEEVTGAGFTTGNLDACGEMKVRIQVKVSVSAPIGSQADLPLTVTSVNDPSKSDTARLVVTVVAP